MSTIFMSAVSNFFYPIGSEAESRSDYVRRTTEKWRKEREFLESLKDKPFCPFLFERIREDVVFKYHDLPLAWKSHPMVWVAYVQSALDFEIEPGECPDKLFLEFMHRENIGFSGKSQDLLYVHGNRFYYNHRHLLMAILLQDFRKSDNSCLLLSDVGALIAKKTKAFHKSSSFHGVPSLSVALKRIESMNLDKHFQLFTAHYPIATFEPSMVDLEDWAYLIPYYGEEGLLSTEGGKRYLIERDMCV